MVFWKLSYVCLEGTVAWGLAKLPRASSLGLGRRLCLVAVGRTSTRMTYERTSKWSPATFCHRNSEAEAQWP